MSKDDEWMNDHVRQGMLMGHLVQKGVAVTPVMEDGNYSHDEIEVSMVDPLVDGNTLTFTLVTKHWKSKDE